MPERAAKEIFGEALELPVGERGEFVRARCGSDGALRERVEALLAASERAEGLFGGGGESGSPGLAPLGILARDVEYGEGARVGPYRVLRRAGRGGFGTVYLAEQREPVARRVALKVLHAGLGSEAALARFDAERQALARMEHPAIARVYDAGTTDAGQPYFAMEFVDGPPITEHCRAAQLGLGEVLQLFRVVCQAVHHAHQKGVVHRDLKPSNVLVAEVDGAPFPKVIDFGIAKAIDRPLTELSLVSVEGQMIGTPAYMSPEQAAGEADVDTRTDVYALGALLYELVSGRAPFEADSLGFAGLMLAIAQDDPPLPSRRVKRDPAASTVGPVPADLDWIAMRCLEKDRSRRYESAHALARDVGRFLDGLPVEAAPPGVGYRLRKLARRHRVAFVAACAFLLALVGGAAGTTVGLVRARSANVELQDALARLHDENRRARDAEARAAEEARHALEQGEVARAVNDFLTRDLLASAVPSAERGRGRDVLLRDVLDVAAESIETSSLPGGRFADKPVVEAAIRAMMGLVYGELGELHKAERHTRRAAELRAAALGPEAPLTLEAQSRLGGQLRQLERYAEADELLVPALAAQRRVAGEADTQTLLSTQRLGMLRVNQGRVEEAWELLRDAHARAVEAHGEESEVALEMLGALAIAAQRSGRDADAERSFRRALELRRVLTGERHPKTAAAMVNLATFLRSIHAYDEAGALLGEVLETQRAVLGEDHPATGTALYNLAALALERGRPAEAEEAARECLVIQTAAFPGGHTSVLQAKALLARCLEGRADPAEVEALYREAYEGCLATLGPDHPITDSRRKDLAGFLFHDPERQDELAELLEESLASQLRRMGPDHPNTLRSMVNLAHLRQRQERREEAERLLRDAVAGLVARHGPDHVETLNAKSALAGHLLNDERFEEAAELARETVEAGASTLEPDDYDLARFRLRHALALHGLGRIDEALEVARATHESLERTRGAQDRMTAFAREALEEWTAETATGGP